MKDIPVADLAKTFLDAALITVQMGYSYLWIDSLCIIQDSEEDWEDQASVMGRVYRHCVFSIAALSSSDSEGGCFRKRNTLSRRGCWLQEPIHRVDHVGVGSYHREKSGFYAEHLDSKSTAPLMQRAWVVQELALAPRTLYYGENMVSWECYAGSSSEVAPYEALKEGSVKEVFKALIMSNALDATKQRWEMWWKLLRKYTSTKLSFEKDRWIALSGLGNLIQEELGLTIVAGLWKQHLISDLLWKCKSPGRRLFIGFPTWSWVSVDVRVGQKMGLIDDSGWSTVAKVSMEEADGARRPEGCDGTVKDSKQGRKPQSMTTRLRSKVHYLSVSGPMLQFTSKTVVNEKGEQDWRVCGFDHELFQWYPDTFADLTRDTWALVLAHTHECPGDGFSNTVHEVAGLVVSPVDEGAGIWSRVGMFHIFRVRLPEESLRLEDSIGSDFERRHILLV